MPIDFLRERLSEESKVAPFTVFSVMVFWSITVAVITSAFWVYPKLAEASETRVQLQNFRMEFTQYRVEDRIDDLNSEELRLRREMERLRVSNQLVPDIYEEQLSRIKTERDNLQRRLDALVAAQLKVAK